MRGALLLILFFCLNATAQSDDVYVGKRPEDKPAPRKKSFLNFDQWKEKVTFGGNFQAWFGNPTFVFLSPTIGYSPVDNFNLGVGVIYNYSKVDFGQYGKYSQSIFGGHSYARYFFTESYFAQVQYDRLRQPNLLSYKQGEKTWIDYLLVGGGLRQSVGPKAALTMSLMYNLTPHLLSIYPSRVILQFGIVAGF